MDLDQSVTPKTIQNVIVTSHIANIVSHPAHGHQPSSSTDPVVLSSSVPSRSAPNSSLSTSQSDLPESSHPGHERSFVKDQQSPTPADNVVVESLPTQHTHISDPSSNSPHGNALNMTGVQQELSVMNNSSGPPVVHIHISPPTTQPSSIGNNPRYLHYRHQTGASPAAVAYHLSQQMQQQYQGGPAAATVPIPHSDASVLYGPHNPPYHTQPVIYHDQYGRQFTVSPSHGPDPTSTPANHQYPTVPSGYPASQHSVYSSLSYANPTPVWIPVHGIQPPPGSSFAYNAPPYPTSYQLGPNLPHSAGPFTFSHAQDLQRRHSVPPRGSRAHNRTPNHGPPTGSGLYPRPPAAPRHSVSYYSPPTLSTRTSTASGLPRGPPRKPKQSGFAVWVGNLPVGANIIDVKDHFSKDLKHEIQSVKMMSKTDCAFINYLSEKGASEALEKFNESRFHGKKLVVRVRRTVPEKNAVPISSDEAADGSAIGSGDSKVKSPPSGPAGARPNINAKDRYFIIKSLTVEDLELSVKTGGWATQLENENKLNQAFEAAENVYLIFSANRSGEYFGFARMASAISTSANPTTPSPPPHSLDRPQSSPIISSSPATPAIPSPSIDPGTEIITPETDTAPRGRIVDDRDTLFWEILTDDESPRPSSPKNTPVIVTSSTSRGNPFRVTWISTKRVPFHLTRGLRNQLNSNREIKIARDATELDEVAGKRLLLMFGWDRSGRRAVVGEESEKEGR